MMSKSWQAMFAVAALVAGLGIPLVAAPASAAPAVPLAAGLAYRNTLPVYQIDSPTTQYDIEPTRVSGPLQLWGQTWIVDMTVAGYTCSSDNGGLTYTYCDPHTALAISGTAKRGTSTRKMVGTCDVTPKNSPINCHLTLAGAGSWTKITLATSTVTTESDLVAGIFLNCLIYNGPLTCIGLPIGVGGLGVAQPYNGIYQQTA